jgi:hypothetical protein
VISMSRIHSGHNYTRVAHVWECNVADDPRFSGIVAATLLRRTLAFTSMSLNSSSSMIGVQDLALPESGFASGSDSEDALPASSILRTTRQNWILTSTSCVIL